MEIMMKRAAWPVLLMTLLLASGASYGIQDMSYDVPSAPFHSEGRRVTSDHTLGDPIAAEVAAAFARGDSAALEAVSRRLLRRQPLTPSGHLPIAFLHGSTRLYLSSPTEEIILDPAFFDKTLRTIRAWQTLYPNSASSYVVEAELYLRRAIVERGGETIDKVPKKKLDAFERDIESALQALIEHEQIGQSTPRWFEVMASVGRCRNMDRRVYIALIDKGMKTHPDDFDLPERGLIYMVPRWGGSHKEVAAYFNHVLAQVEPKNAPIVASSMYHTLTVSGNYYAGIDLSIILKTSVKHIQRGWQCASNDSQIPATSTCKLLFPVRWVKKHCLDLCLNK